MTAVKALPVSPSSLSSSTMFRSKNQRAGTTLSTRRLLFLSAVLGTALIAFNVSVRPIESNLHANPIRGGGVALNSAHEGSVPGVTEGRRVNRPQALEPRRPKEPSPSEPQKRQSDAACKFRVRSVRDLQKCYPPQLVRELPPETCSNVTEWKDVQRCLNTSPKRPASADSPPPAFSHYDISLIGERNSGTKFLIHELQQCFRRLSSTTSGLVNSTSSTERGEGGGVRPTVKIHRDFHRHKHFFQPLYSGDSYRHRIVIALFRDPIEWVAAMRENPYHSPAHVAGYEPTSGNGRNQQEEGSEFRVIPLPWHEFVRRPWTTDRTRADLDILRNASLVKETFKGETCLYRYSVLDAVPCRFDNETTSYPPIPDPLLRGYVPLYELRRDLSQRPFDSLLQLRAEKIVNFLIEVPLVYKNLGGYVAARYEDLLLQGTKPLLEYVAGLMGLPGLPSDCIPAGPQPERLGRRPVPADFRRWIIDHMDRDLERLLGYYPPT